MTMGGSVRVRSERRARSGGPKGRKIHGDPKAMTAKLGVPKLEGKEAVGGKAAPALYFGSTKINNNFDVVDAVGKKTAKE